MSASVSLRKCDSYDPATVSAAVRECVDSLGGFAAFVQPGQTVLLKPNLLASRGPDDPTPTHAEFIGAVIRCVQEAGGRALVGDSPGYLSARRVASASGLLKVIDELGAELVEFNDVVEADGVEGGTFPRFEVARPVLEADVVINLPKIKTHGMMLLTLGVKNMFGSVVGTRKGQWHLRAGRDPAFFARMLVELYLRVKPALTIADGVIAMEGDGPNSGTATQLGLVAASDDAVALDVVLATVLGVDPFDVPTTATARELKAGEARLDQIDVRGGEPGDFAPSSFQLPSSHVHTEMLSPLIRGWSKRLLTPKPVIDHATCKRCHVCVKACPPQVMSETNDRIEIDRDGCIRCFCCQELCPEGAVSIRSPWLYDCIERVERYFSK